jgi:mannose-6-phosphate isomerase-like protein (cupin superfamily)
MPSVAMLLRAPPDLVLTIGEKRRQTVEEMWYVLDSMAEMWRALDELERIALMKARAGLAIRPGTRFQFRTAGTKSYV